MANTFFDIEERVWINYELRYDEDALKKTGYATIKEYVEEELDNNPFREDKNGVVTNVEQQQIAEFVESYYDLLCWE